MLHRTGTNTTGAGESGNKTGTDLSAAISRITVSNNVPDVVGSPPAKTNTLARRNLVRVGGAGVEGLDVTVGELTAFSISTSNAGQGEVYVNILDPSGTKLDVTLESINVTSIRCMYKPTVEGLHTIFVNFGGIDLKGSPFKVQVLGKTSSPVSPSSKSPSHKPHNRPSILPGRDPEVPRSPLSSSPASNLLYPGTFFNPPLPPRKASTGSITRQYSGNRDIFLECEEFLNFLSPVTRMELIPSMQAAISFERGTLLGKGHFGAVFEARVTTVTNGAFIAAAKGLSGWTMRGKEASARLEEFIREACWMQKFQHENVMSLIAVVLHDEIPYILMPLMVNGSLKAYLEGQKQRGLGEDVLLSFALQTARAMEYLSDIKVVHRDLSARNCMLDEELTVKVSDFGLTRDTIQEPYVMSSREKKLPIRWMAPEITDNMRFNMATDVWSFGVTLWEIFSYGDWPYQQVPDPKILDFIISGKRLKKPAGAKEPTYALMLQCWNPLPAIRPTFKQIARLLEEQLDSFIKAAIASSPSSPSSSSADPSARKRVTFNTGSHWRR